MADFSDFESLYEHLEKNASEYEYSFQIGREFQKLRDLKEKEKKTDEAEKAQWEMDFFNFSVDDGLLKPISEMTNDKGEVIRIPDIDLFDEKAYSYLIERFEAVSTPVLKARYAHILWCSPKKHNKYAKAALDAYLELVALWESKDRKQPEEHHGLKVLDSVNSAYVIAYGARYKIAEVKAELIRLVKEFNYESSSSFALRANIMELMLNRKRRFSEEDFDGFQDICWRLSETLNKKGNSHAAITMLELGERIDLKAGVKDPKWRRRIAESYELMMNQRGDGDLAAISFCQDAISNFKIIKDNKKVKELEKKYTALKGSAKLEEFEHKIDIKKHLDACQKLAQKISKKPADEIIKILMASKDLLPRYDDMKKIAEEHGKKFVMQHIVPVEILDQSGHPAQHFGTDEEKEYYRILYQYDFHLKLDKIYLINAILFESINKRKLTSENVLDFLNKYSWYGKNISKGLPNEKTLNYNWLNLLAPAIHDYINRINLFFLNPQNSPNTVLCIDSLTLKFEGLFRDVCEFSGVPTFLMTKDKQGRKIVREKDIHALLYEEPIKKLFDKDDLLFFRFLLVEKAGLNLRHRVAHSLIRFEEYTIVYMSLLFLALLRLGKYDFVKKEVRVSHD
jgi:hypothetical protein